MQVLRKLENKPEKVFDDIPEDHKCDWYESHDKRGCFGHVALHFYDENNCAEVHLSIHRWTLETARISRHLGMQEIVNVCKKKGVSMMVATNENVDDQRWPKLLKMMGWPKPELVYVSVMGV